MCYLCMCVTCVCNMRYVCIRVIHVDLYVYCICIRCVMYVCNVWGTPHVPCCVGAWVWDREHGCISMQMHVHAYMCIYIYIGRSRPLSLLSSWSQAGALILCVCYTSIYVLYMDIHMHTYICMYVYIQVIYTYIYTYLHTHIVNNYLQCRHWRDAPRPPQTRRTGSRQSAASGSTPVMSA